MIDDQDHYEAYYADKLWGLLPTVYRSEDTDRFDVDGPFRELVNRIGAQAAILRRGLDRLWEDQSIETCDDWVVPYIGDLLATNLVARLDARGQRIDVARTIYYRRRKGTLGVIEEIASDITGWDAKVVEFFRRLARTRHSIDPPLGQRSGADSDLGTLQRAEGLVGPVTGTGIGGFADLRNAYGASRAHSAFDEFFHTADFRFGQGKVGWYNIPRVGIFLWRLKSFPVGVTTPVAVKGCDGWFTFDPTGREIPLFAADSRGADSYGNNWVSPTEAQLPTPIDQALGNAPNSDFPLDPGSFAVYSKSVPQVAADMIAPGLLKIRPPQGKFFKPSTVRGPAWVMYHYGFSSEIGAGPYDRRLVGGEPETSPTVAAIHGGGPIHNLPASGVVEITDSLTYTAIDGLKLQGEFTLRARNEARPVVRLAPTKNGWTAWTIEGKAPAAGAPGNCLRLEGLFLSGADLVIRGVFDCVTLSCSTLDPGDVPPAGSPPGTHFAPAADGRDLVPCRVWIEGRVGTLTVDRCITGAIRTRGTGHVATVNVNDSIIQAIPTTLPGPILSADVKDSTALIRAMGGTDPVPARLRALSPTLAQLFSGSVASTSPHPSLKSVLDALNALLAGPSLYDVKTFGSIVLSVATRTLLNGSSRASTPAPTLNRLLLEDAFPMELAEAALAFGDGDVGLSRCTVMGRVVVHRLRASECLIPGFLLVDDLQHGCVRFSAWGERSVVPRQYESVQVAQDAAPFSSTRFGRPDYAQLLPTVDAAILPTAGPPPTSPLTISTGAEDGSEMGAFARERNAIKERALRIKLQEFLPAGLVPVLINVT